MLSISFLVVSIAIFFATDAQPPNTLASFGIPYNQFHCGPGDFVTEHLVKWINESCPVAAPDINHCCAIHKNCYINQREQETCDVNFCKCFDNLIAHNKDSKPCKPVTDSACSGVKIYGQNSYLNLKDSKFNHKNVPSVPKIFQEYSKLYNECPHQMVTLSSCALNHDICMAKKKKNCALPLIQCLVVVEFDVNKNANCGRAIQNILNMLLFSQKPVGNSPTQPIVYRVREGSNNFAAMYHRVALPGNAIFFYFTFFGIILICGLLIVVAYIRMDSPVPTSSIGAPVTSATASPHTPR